ncbi:MAG: SgcJ/EcaC family oxidoreductase [Thermoanaerobaculia bacterium]
MKKVFAAAALSALLAGFSTPARADQGAKAAVEKLRHEFISAWNAHDAKKMASVWWEDGDLINPFGRVEKGREAIEKLFVEEQSGVMKPTTYKVESTSLREIGSNVAIEDWVAVVTGMKAPDGKAMPDFRHNVTFIALKRDGRWSAVSVRAYVFMPMPAAPATAAK